MRGFLFRVCLAGLHDDDNDDAIRAVQKVDLTKLAHRFSRCVCDLATRSATNATQLMTMGRVARRPDLCVCV